jgi:hypothetical protein
MAFTAKDGSKHTNHSSYKSANARLGAHEPQKGEAPEESMGGEPEEGSDGAQIASEHGPAHVIDIQHDHEGGRHTVHAMHPDGHEHETEHASADEAHKFAGDCAGCGMS